MDWSKVAKNELSRRLAEKVNTDGFRKVTDDSGVSRGSVEHIIYGLQRLPRMDTVNKLAKYFSLPVWRIIEMAGFEADLPGAGKRGAEEARIAQILINRDDLRPIVEGLGDLTDDEVRAVRAYLEALRSLRPAAPARDGEG